MGYTCARRFVSTNRNHYRVNDEISEGEYNRLNEGEKENFIPPIKSFQDQLEDNIEEDDKAEKEDV